MDEVSDRDDRMDGDYDGVSSVSWTKGSRDGMMDLVRNVSRKIGGENQSAAPLSLRKIGGRPQDRVQSTGPVNSEIIRTTSVYAIACDWRLRDEGRWHQQRRKIELTVGCSGDGGKIFRENAWLRSSCMK